LYVKPLNELIKKIKVLQKIEQELPSLIQNEQSSRDQNQNVIALNEKLEFLKAELEKEYDNFSKLLINN
jgi:hypothetical protein